MIMEVQRYRQHLLHPGVVLPELLIVESFGCYQLKGGKYCPLCRVSHEIILYINQPRFLDCVMVSIFHQWYYTIAGCIGLAFFGSYRNKHWQTATVYSYSMFQKEWQIGHLACHDKIQRCVKVDRMQAVPTTCYQLL